MTERVYTIIQRYVSTGPGLGESAWKDYGRLREVIAPDDIEAINKFMPRYHRLTNVVRKRKP